MNRKLSLLLNLSMLFVLTAAPLAARPINEKPGHAKEGKSMRESKKGDWESFHKKKLAKLTEKLSLSTEQSEKISQILKEGWEKIKTEREAMKKRVKELREASDKKIEELLSEEQKNKFREYREKRKERMGTRKKHRCKKESPETE